MDPFRSMKGPIKESSRSQMVLTRFPYVPETVVRELLPLWDMFDQ